MVKIDQAKPFACANLDSMCNGDFVAVLSLTLSLSIRSFSFSKPNICVEKKEWE